jgi:ornithine cyclodeaminase/alanine dehydrogenase-like protein (mu-crystallin family)
MSADDVAGELGALLEELAPQGSDGPRPPLLNSRPVVFDSTGTGFQDAAAAAALVRAAGPDAGVEVALDR